MDKFKNNPLAKVSGCPAKKQKKIIEENLYGR